jgi:hypothetical protein
LQSLIDSKILLVDGMTTKLGSNEEVSNSQSTCVQSSDTVYSLNLNYSNKRMKFKVTAVQQKEVQVIVRLNSN